MVFTSQMAYNGCRGFRPSDTQDQRPSGGTLQNRGTPPNRWARATARSKPKRPKRPAPNVSDCGIEVSTVAAAAHQFDLVWEEEFERDFDVEWACEACTFLNSHRLQACAMCGASISGGSTERHREQAGSAAESEDKKDGMANDPEMCLQAETWPALPMKPAVPNLSGEEWEMVDEEEWEMVDLNIAQDTTTYLDRLVSTPPAKNAGVPQRRRTGHLHRARASKRRNAGDSEAVTPDDTDTEAVGEEQLQYVRRTRRSRQSAKSRVKRLACKAISPHY